MKKTYLTIAFLTLAFIFTSCNDFLTLNPRDTVTDTPEFWNSEDNIRTAVLDIYTNFFVGYNSGWNRSDYFSETNVADWNDDNAQETATFFTKVAPASTSGTNWDFTLVRHINVMLNRVKSSTLDDEAKNHWMGVLRFFRALEYSQLVNLYGDVPYFEEALDDKDYDSLYRARDKRTDVMDKVLDDLNFASQNIRVSDGEAGLTVNRDVANAYGSRLMLFEGTWEKYREHNTEYAKKYLEAAKNFADLVINSNRYHLCDNYLDLTTSEDLAGNPEVILYRSYVEGIVTHSLMSFQNTLVEIDSPSKSLVDSYLSNNGLPIHQNGNTIYRGDKWFSDEMSNRDPRLYANVDTTGLKLNGIATIYATSGYFSHLFVNESLKDKAGGQSSTCITDAPIMRYDEVLMNDIEAAAELNDLGDYKLTQQDLDKTINVLRDRPSTHMPHITLLGNNLQVNGITINDPDRDSDVPAILWEIRRERRDELPYSGIRFYDIRRWGKLQYADMIKNPKLNMGAWLDKNKYVNWYNTIHPENKITVDQLSKIKLDRDGNAGYIVPITDQNLMRTATDKDYLYPIPEDQITLYKSRGYTLTQNPGW